MKLFVNESKTETTVEIDKDITIDVDISKLDDNERSELLTELLENMPDDDIEDCIDENDRMIKVILKSHVYCRDKDLRYLFYILEGDANHDELKKDLRSLIEKYNLQDEL